MHKPVCDDDLMYTEFGSVNPLFRLKMLLRNRYSSISADDMIPSIQHF